MTNKIDDIDWQILSDLQEDGRMSNVDLSKRIGISAPPCLRRVKRLEKKDYIKSYHAKLNATLLGYQVMAFAQVGLISQKEEDLLQFENLILSWPMVRECYMCAGEADFILKVVAKDWDEYQKFVSSSLTRAPNVKHVKTSMVLRQSKDEPGIPIDSKLKIL